MPLLGFEPTISAGERPQTRALDRTANGTGHLYRGADKSLGQPGRKQTTATEDFDVHISYL